MITSFYYKRPFYYFYFTPTKLPIISFQLIQMNIAKINAVDIAILFGLIHPFLLNLQLLGLLIRIFSTSPILSCNPHTLDPRFSP